jgi:drug/metabolite transporter (DMT)-like permease
MFGMLLVALALGAAGQLLMKKGLNLIGQIGDVGTLFKACVHPLVLAGLGFYVVSSMLYLVLMSRMHLSVLYPMVALNYVFITLLSWYFFDDHVNAQRLLGLAVIIMGVTIVGFSQRPSDAQMKPAGVAEGMQR